MSNSIHVTFGDTITVKAINIDSASASVINGYILQARESADRAQSASNVAKLIIDAKVPYVTPEAFLPKNEQGVYIVPPEDYDWSDAIQAAFNHSGLIIFEANKVYEVGKDLRVTNGCRLELNNARIQSKTRNGESSVVYVEHVNNISIRNGYIVGDRATRTNGTENCHCLRMFDAENIYIDNVMLTEGYADGLFMRGCTNVEIPNIETCYNGRNNFSIISGSNLRLGYLHTHHCYGTLSPGHGFVIEGFKDNLDTTDFSIDVVYAHNNKGRGVQISNYYNINIDARINVICTHSNGHSLGINANVNAKGGIYIDRVLCKGEKVFIADACSDDYSVNINTIEMDNVPAETALGYYQSAVQIYQRNSSVALKHIHIDKILIHKGEHMYICYISGSATEACIDVIVNNAKCLNGRCSLAGTKGTLFTNIQENVVADIGTSGTFILNSLNVCTVLETSRNVTLDDYYNKNQIVEIKNVGTNAINITSTENNVGLPTLSLVGGASIKVKRVGYAKWQYINPSYNVSLSAGASKEVNIANTTYIKTVRGTHTEFFVVAKDVVTKLKTDTSTGLDIVASGNTITMTNTASAVVNAYIFP